MRDKVNKLLRPVFWYIEMGYYEMAIVVFIRAIPFLKQFNTETEDMVESRFFECWDEICTKSVYDAGHALHLLRATALSEIDFFGYNAASRTRLELLQISCLTEKEKIAVLMYDIITGFKDRVTSAFERITSYDDSLLDELLNAFVEGRFVATRKRL